MSISGGCERKPPAGYPSCLRNVVPVNLTRSCAFLFSCHVLSLLLYGILGTAAQRYAIWRRKILLVKVGWFQISRANCIESSETK